MTFIYQCGQHAVEGTQSALSCVARGTSRVASFCCYWIIGPWPLGEVLRDNVTTPFFVFLRTPWVPDSPPPNADLTNDTDLAHNVGHTITRDHYTRTAPSNHPDR